MRSGLGCGSADVTQWGIAVRPPPTPPLTSNYDVVGAAAAAADAAGLQVLQVVVMARKVSLQVASAAAAVPVRGGVAIHVCIYSTARRLLSETTP